MSVNDLAAAMQAAIGTNDEAQGVTGWLDSNYPPLNKVLGGDYDKGLPYGRIVEIFGPPSAGKTALATNFMVAAQNKGGIAMFNDHENTFQKDMATQVGLKTEFPYWIYQRPDTWEQSNTIAMKAAAAFRESKQIPAEAPFVCVFDSVAAMIPKSQFEKGIDEYTMNDTTALARVSSTTLKAVNAVTSRLNASMIYLNQVRTKPGVAYGDPNYTPGGVSMEFYASIRLSLTRSKVMNDDKEMVGHIINIKATKNKVARPFQTCSLRLAFGDDGMVKFDFTTSLIEYMIENGYLEYSKPRVTWEGKKYFVKELSKHIDEQGLYPKLKSMLVKP